MLVLATSAPAAADEDGDDDDDDDDDDDRDPNKGGMDFFLAMTSPSLLMPRHAVAKNAVLFAEKVCATFQNIHRTAPMVVMPSSLSSFSVTLPIPPIFRVGSVSKNANIDALDGGNLN